MSAKDIISRETLKRLTTDLARHLLGIEAEAIELLETQHQRVEDRRADLVARMRATDSSEFLLHVEIANNNKGDMALRMLRYYTDIRFARHDGPPQRRGGRRLIGAQRRGRGTDRRQRRFRQARFAVVGARGPRSRQHPVGD